MKVAGVRAGRAEHVLASRSHAAPEGEQSLEIASGAPWGAAQDVSKICNRLQWAAISRCKSATTVSSVPLPAPRGRAGQPFAQDVSKTCNRLQWTAISRCKSATTASIVPLPAPRDVTIEVKGVGSDDARTRGFIHVVCGVLRFGCRGRVPLRVPLLYSEGTLNRWARSSAAWGIDNRRLWAQRSRTLPLRRHEASKH
jgi:hypothetical protein